MTRQGSANESVTAFCIGGQRLDMHEGDSSVGLGLPAATKEAQSSTTPLCTLYDGVIRIDLKEEKGATGDALVSPLLAKSTRQDGPVQTKPKKNLCNDG